MFTWTPSSDDDHNNNSDNNHRNSDSSNFPDNIPILDPGRSAQQQQYQQSIEVDPQGQMQSYLVPQQEDTTATATATGNDTMSSSNNNNNNSSINNTKWAKISGVASCVVLVIISIGLISASLRKVEETEYGLLYDVWTKQLDDEAQSGGLFTGPPGFRFIKFPSTFVTIDLNNRFCVSRDGLVVEFSVTFQYQMIAKDIVTVVERYRDFDKWNRIVGEAGLSAIHHSCSDFYISNFQNKRGEIQAKMEENLRIKLAGNQTTAANSTDGSEGVYAQAISLQLRNLELPEEYSNAVRDKQSAEEDIALAVNQRQQETTRARTALLRAKEEARKILDTANNDVEILLTEASLSAEETTFAFAQEARTLVDVKESLGLSTDGVLAWPTICWRTRPRWWR